MKMYCLRIGRKKMWQESINLNNKYLQKSLKLAVRHSEVKLSIEGWRLSANSKVLSCSMLDCPWKNWMAKMHLSWVVACAWARSLEGSAQITDSILGSSLHSAMQDLKAVLAQSKHWNIVIQFPSIYDKTCWIFLAALPPFASMSLRPCPPTLASLCFSVV